MCVVGGPHVGTFENDVYMIPIPLLINNNIFKYYIVSLLSLIISS